MEKVVDGVTQDIVDGSQLITTTTMMGKQWIGNWDWIGKYTNVAFLDDNSNL